MRPISPKMLIGTATLYNASSVDEDRQTVWSDAITLDHVYVEYTEAWSDGSTGKTSSDSAQLYYDLRNSKASINGTETEPQFHKGDRITHNGIDYTVTYIAPALDGTHHLTIGLAG